jgi:hypothetical protein
MHIHEFSPDTFAISGYISRGVRFQQLQYKHEALAYLCGSTLIMSRASWGGNMEHYQRLESFSQEYLGMGWERNVNKKDDKGKQIPHIFELNGGQLPIHSVTHAINKDNSIAFNRYIVTGAVEREGKLIAFKQLCWDTGVLAARIHDDKYVTTRFAAYHADDKELMAELLTYSSESVLTRAVFEGRVKEVEQDELDLLPIISD